MAWVLLPAAGVSLCTSTLRDVRSPMVCAGAGTATHSSAAAVRLPARRALIGAAPAGLLACYRRAEGQGLPRATSIGGEHEASRHRVGGEPRLLLLELLHGKLREVLALALFGGGEARL